MVSIMNASARRTGIIALVVLFFFSLISGTAFAVQEENKQNPVDKNTAALAKMLHEAHMDKQSTGLETGEQCSVCPNHQEGDGNCCANGSGNCCSHAVSGQGPDTDTQTARRKADEWMLMMQGMAGIGPKDSKWVASKLFDGFIPAPMPCCGLAGSKDEGQQHQCCNRQATAQKESERAAKAERAFVRYSQQFGQTAKRSSLVDKYLSLGIGPSRMYPLPEITELPEDFLVPQITPDGRKVMSGREWGQHYAMIGTVPLPGGYVQYLQSMGVLPGSKPSLPAMFELPKTAPPLPDTLTDFEGIRIDVFLAGDDAENKLRELGPVKHYRIAAISLDIVYNRFGGHDPKGMSYVLEQDRTAVLDGNGYFNGGHDPLFFGSRDLFLKNPRADKDSLDCCGRKTKVLTAQPLVIRANRGETFVIDFTNRLQIDGQNACQEDSCRANINIHGAQYNFAFPQNNQQNTAPLPDPNTTGYQLRYIVRVGDRKASKGTYYFHSQPVLFDKVKIGLQATVNQVSHGLFGALIIEPPGSKYYDPYSFRIKKGTEDGFGNYEIDPKGYRKIDSGWGAIVASEKEIFREYVLFFHDNLNKKIEGLVELDPRAINYRTEPFADIFNSFQADTPKPFAVNDHSMAYSAYTYGESSTPHPRFYVGDPVRYRVIHAGVGDQFHVFHHHAHRWRFQPNVPEPTALDSVDNLTMPSKWGLPEFTNQPDVTTSTSIRLDSQTLGPSETFDVFFEGGAGGVQRTVGDVLLHCHIIDHVLRGMWTYARIYNTLQQRTEHLPGLAPLQDRNGEDIQPPIAVDALKLAELVRKGQGPVPVSGPLAGKPIEDVEKKLYPFIRAQLPVQGEPDFDEFADPDDEVKINRANKWDWDIVVVNVGEHEDSLYRGEPYDMGGPNVPGPVHFGDGFPTVGEGAGYNHEKTERPRLLFNPKDGRLAYPHLLPYAGRRPPFAPWRKLTSQGKLEVDLKQQGAAYLGPTFAKNDPGRVNGEAVGVPTGSGLAPIEAEENPDNVKHYDLVALQLPIDYSTHNGAVVPNSLFGRGVDNGQSEEPRTIVISGGDIFTSWLQSGQQVSEILVRPGDTIQWDVIDMEHGVVFSHEDTAKAMLEFEDIVGRPLEKVSGALFNSLPRPWGNIDGFSEGILARSTVKDVPEDQRKPVEFVCFVHGVSMTAKLVFKKPANPNVDPNGQIFVLRDDVPDIMAGRKRAEPLVLRANAGDIIDITLTSALVDLKQNEFYSKVGIHTHLVQYDVQSSDGAVAGLNYETSIRPSLKWDPEQQKLVQIKDELSKYHEQVHYRWWCDVELGTIYFHDHSLLINSLPHGLFGATVVEPYNASYHDPQTGKPLYVPNKDQIITATSGRNGLARADIHINRPGETGFREFVPLFNDSNRPAGASINLRNEPILNRIMDDKGRPVPFLPLWKQGQPYLQGGMETAFSSLLHGDPVTPIWRAYQSDGMRIRTEGGGTNQIHTLNLHGHRWRYEPFNPMSTLRDFILVGVSEGFSFVVDTLINAPPSDYLYSSQGENDLINRGKWGLLRIYPSSIPDTEGTKAEGTIRVYLDNFANVTVPKGHRFTSARGVSYLAVEEESHADSTLKKNVTHRFAKPHYFFDVELEAEFVGEEGNVPEETRFAADPSEWFDAQNGTPPNVAFIKSVREFGGGKSPLMPLSQGANTGEIQGETPDEGEEPQVTEVEVPPATEPDGPVTFHVAALPVTVPALVPSQGRTIEIDGTADILWMVDGKPATDVLLRSGDIVIWKARGGFHGVLFPSQVEAEAALTFEQDGLPPLEERQGMWGTDGFAAAKILARAVVKPGVPEGTKLTFICTVHGGGMNGSLAFEGSATGRTIEIDGTAAIMWVVDGQPATDVMLRSGDIVIWKASGDSHGVLFPSQAEAEAVLTFEQDGLPLLEDRQGMWGTEGFAAVKILARGVVKPGVPEGTKLTFICTVHGEGMNGSLAFEGSASGRTIEIDGTQDITWVVGGQPATDVTVRPGDILIWKNIGGTHGLVFPSQAEAEAVLTFEQDGQLPLLAMQTVNGEDVWGTTPFTVGQGDDPKVLARATVKSGVAEGTKLTFFCTQHGRFMNGNLAVGDGSKPEGEAALVYMELRTDQERALADSITQKTRGQVPQDLDLAEEEIKQLRGLLRDRFSEHPEPLVLRVAAGRKDYAGNYQPVKVTVRLTNLLPNVDEFGSEFEPNANDRERWSSTTSLHVSLLRYAGAQSDGAAIGNNQHSLVLRGDSRNYQWEIDRELGVCYFRDMADPTHQKYGLFGALIVEPPGSHFEKSVPEDSDPPGIQARIRTVDPSKSFREFVIFTHDTWSQEKANAMNYYSASGLPDSLSTPPLRVHAGDSVFVRQLHAAGSGALVNHSFFIDGRRWPFDFQNDRSNRISTIAEAPSAAFNIRFEADPEADDSVRKYIYGCHVGSHLVEGEWGLFFVLPPGDESILPLKESEEEVSQAGGLLNKLMEDNQP